MASARLLPEIGIKSVYTRYAAKRRGPGYRARRFVRSRWLMAESLENRRLLACSGLNPVFSIDGRIQTDIGMPGMSDYGHDVVAVEGDDAIQGCDIRSLGRDLALDIGVDSLAVDHVFADAAQTTMTSAASQQSSATNIRLVADDDHGDDARAATPISVPSVTSGDIDLGGDTDWFQFSAVAGAEYVFETTLVTLPDTQLALYAADGTTLLVSDDDGGDGLASRIEWTAPARGTHFLEVRPYRSFQRGIYTLDVSVVGGDDHGNDAGTATPISARSVTPGNIEVGGDTDWFRFTAVAGAEYVFETTLESLTDTKLALYGTNGTTQLRADDDGGEGLASRIAWTAQVNGTHYLQVSAFNDFQTGTYTLDASGDGVDDDHGDNAGTATPIVVPSVTPGNIEVGGDSDWFQFTAEAGARYVFGTSLGSLADSHLTLYSGNGTTQLDVDDDSGDGSASRIDWTAPTNGTHYLEVTSFNSSEIGTYSLNVSVSGGDDHGNDAGTATPIAVPSMTPGDIEADGDTDWFQFTAAAGTHYVLATTLDSLPDSKLVLYAADGTTELDVDDDGGGGSASRIRWTATTNGTHYLEVTAFNNSDTGTYTLDVSEGVADDHGNNAETATPITITSANRGDIEDGGDSDWFQFTAEVGAHYVFATALGTLDDSKLTLYATDGTTQLELADDSGNGTASRIDWTARTSGTHYLEVTAFTSAQTGTYSLNVSSCIGDGPGVLALNVHQIIIAENAGSSLATVSRTGTSGSLSVNLTSSDTSEAVVPSSVTIPDGFNSVTFDVTAVDDIIADGTQTLTITAAAGGHTSGTDTIYVTDNETEGDDHGNDAGTATPISIPSVTTGEIEADLDTDWFQFTAVAGTEYVFETVLGTLDDSTLTLFAANGTTQLDVDDDGGEGFASRIEWTAQVSGTHYLDVTTFRSSELGTYALDISVGGGDDHGNDAGTATSVTVPSATPGDVDVVEDTDWFEFTAVAGAQYIFSTTLGTLDDSRLAVYAADGTTQLDVDDDSGDESASRIEWTAPAGGKHYLEVIAFSSLRTGTYTLNIASCAVTSPGVLTLDVQQTSMPENGGSSLATVTRNGTTGTLSVNLISSDTSEAVVPPLVTIPDGFNSATFTVTAVDDFVADGTQTVTITASASAHANGTDTILVSDTDTDTVDDDHGNAAGTATPLTIPSVTLGDIEVGGDTDWFQFTAVVGTRYVFETTLDSLANSNLALYAANGTTQLDVDDDSGEGSASRIEWTATTSGTHYLEVTGASGSETGTYTLGVSLTLVDGDDHGNSAASATPITIPSVTPGEIDEGDTDWFQFTAVAGSQYVFETTLDSLIDTKLALYAADGTTQLDTDDDGGDGLASRIEWTAPSSGSHYLEVTAFSNSQTGTYALGVSGTVAGGLGALTVNIIKTSMAEHDGWSLATVSRSGTLGALSVNLNSSDTTEAVVPSFVTIPNGASSATFSVRAVDDFFADGTQTVTITASAGGHTNGTDTIMVTDNETAGAALGLLTLDEPT